MARRGSGTSMWTLVKFGAVVGVGMLGYGYITSHGLPGVTSAHAAPASGGTSAGTHNCSFVTGVQYVAPLPNGQFEVVLGGKQVKVTNSKSEAEQYYNSALGC